MVPLTFIEFSLPVTDPTWRFFIVMAIILLAPIIFGKLRIPHIVGMILAGILIGQHGFNILEYDSSFELFGQVGLYYIMFVAGLEMDMEDFRKHSSKAIVFGLITFALPMILGILSGRWILHYAIVPSVLLASMYASHTLVAYPIVSRYGLSHQRSVNITVGGTALTVALALLVLAGITGMHQGGMSPKFWLLLALKVTLIVLAIIFLLPPLTRWFFRRYTDAVLQYIFVLAMVFLGGGLLAMAGMEGILGAFIVGIVINPLIPKVSPLMTRIEFVGNALFIPYFLIGVGMIIDVRSLFTGGEALKVAIVMTAVATISKWLAALITQRIYGMNGTERKMMFGLSNAQAAATLAAVMIGHSIILENGERLLSDAVLNGTVVMILFTCIISTLVSEQAAKRFALGLAGSTPSEQPKEQEKLLIPVANPDTIENLINLALIVKDPAQKSGLVALNVIDSSAGSPEKEAAGKRSLERAARIASSANVKTEMVSRYDMNVSSGIINTIKEQEATVLIVGLHQKGRFMDTYFGYLTSNLLKGTGREIIIARLMMPISTVKGIVAIVPPRAEFEAGFSKWVTHLCRIASSLSCRLQISAEQATAEALRPLIDADKAKSLVNVIVSDRQSFVPAKVSLEQLYVVVSARKGTVSYDSAFDKLPAMLDKNFHDNNLVVLYPEQVNTAETTFFSDPIH